MILGTPSGTNNGSIRVDKFVAPTIDTLSRRVILKIYTIKAILIDGAWQHIEETVRQAGSMAIDDTVSIDPATGAAVANGTEGSVPAYQYLCTMTLAQAGATALSDGMYAVIAAALERFASGG